jgi:hypothetical protein
MQVPGIKAFGFAINKPAGTSLMTQLTIKAYQATGTDTRPSRVTCGFVQRPFFDATIQIAGGQTAGTYKATLIASDEQLGDPIRFNIVECTLYWDISGQGGSPDLVVEEVSASVDLCLGLCEGQDVATWDYAAGATVSARPTLQGKIWRVVGDAPRWTSANSGAFLPSLSIATVNGETVLDVDGRAGLSLTFQVKKLPGVALTGVSYRLAKKSQELSGFFLECGYFASSQTWTQLQLVIDATNMPVNSLATGSVTVSGNTAEALSTSSVICRITFSATARGGLYLASWGMTLKPCQQV